MTDQVYAHGSAIQTVGMNHLVGLMTSGEQANEVVRIINLHDDLVAALESCRAWHNGDKWRDSPSCNHKESWEIHRDIIDSALAKATK